MTNYESGVRFLNRIHNRKNPVTVLNRWFPEETAFNQQTVEIVGLPSTGKTFVLFDLISDIILPLEANGLNAIAILISNDQNFDIVKLMEICVSKKKSIDIDDVLKRLLIIENYDEFQLKLSIQRVESLISSLKNVALVAVDNLLAFYWQNRDNKSFQKAEVYSKMFVEKLRESCLLSSAIMVYTRPQFNSNDYENDHIPEIRPKMTNKRIILRRNGSQFEAECQSASGVSSKKFTIGKSLSFVP